MDIFQRIDAIVAELQTPVTELERSCGWNEINKEKVAQFFLRQRQIISEGGRIPRYALIRALDFDGVFEGALLERVAEVDNAINDT